ncbi:hypothetical protein U9M48_008585 [Paspalum notatum var. saurae]|uniref:Retrotransposon gag domain-containing protein n=2 Tax=Poaceae TaxID=4479 RepID=A0AAQ3WDI5_PASNO
MGEAKIWCKQVVGKVEGSWEDLKNSFCLHFFPPNKVIDLRCEVFNFRQRERESLGAAWERFNRLASSGPDLCISEAWLLQHFVRGLTPRADLCLDLASGGSFYHLTPSEGRKILDKILEKASDLGTLEEPPPQKPPKTLETEESCQYNTYLLFSFVAVYLFSIGIYGLITSRNMVRALICLELILNSINLNLVTFSIRLSIRKTLFFVFSL